MFPVAGFFFGLARKRVIDAIAIMSMVGITLHVGATLLSKDVGMVLVARSFEGAAIGLVLIISALVGRPIILLVAKQFAAGGGAETQGRALDRNSERGFKMITVIWGIFLILMSGVHVALALNLAPANFLLVSPVLGLVTNFALVAFSGWYLFRHLPRNSI